MNPCVVTLEIDPMRIAQLIECALGSGGIVYWCSLEEVERGAGERGEPSTYPLCGGSLTFREREDRGAGKWSGRPLLKLDGPAIAQGLALMSTTHVRHFANFITEREDANTGDVFVQLCLFGEVVYG